MPNAIKEKHKQPRLEFQNLASVRTMSQVNTDPFTKVTNRRANNRQLSAAISPSNRQQNPLALCIIDMDHFKAVNEKHSHQVGKDVL